MNTVAALVSFVALAAAMTIIPDHSAPPLHGAQSNREAVVRAGESNREQASCKPSGVVRTVTLTTARISFGTGVSRRSLPRGERLILQGWIGALSQGCSIKRLRRGRSE
jgi:hypothetical protein